MLDEMDHADDFLVRTERAQQRVVEWLRTSTAALDAVGIRYAVIGDMAIAAFVRQVDPSAVRGSPDVELLIDRADLTHVHAAFNAAGFLAASDGPIGHYRHRESPSRRASVRLRFAHERRYASDFEPAPGVETFVRIESYRVLCLDPLARLHLSVFRALDRVHLYDLIDIRLIDASWLGRLQPELAARLQELLDTPDG